MQLEKQKYGLFRVAQKINDNAYVLELPFIWNISRTFNVVELFKYHPDDEVLCELNSRMSSLPSEED